MTAADLNRVRQWLKEARFVVVLTGAGVSAESGVCRLIAGPEDYGREAIFENWLRWKDFNATRRRSGPGTTNGVGNSSRSARIQGIMPWLNWKGVLVGLL
jgi:hypothetical protein